MTRDSRLAGLARTFLSVLSAALVASASGTGPVAAQTLPRAAPEAVGMSSERLARLDSVAAAYVRDGRLTGVVTLVARAGRVVHEGVYGMMDVETKAPMGADAIFRIASMTKPIVSVAALMLVEEGRMLLSDPVSRFIPAFASTTVAVPDGDSVQIVPANRPISIRDLLAHTAGVAGVGGVHPALRAQYLEVLDTTPIVARDEPVGAYVARLGRLPFAAQPGEAFVYGDATHVLGAVVEVASGMALDEFLRRRIFEPLHMRDTHYYLPESKAPRLAPVYALQEGGGLTRYPDDHPARGRISFVSGPRRFFGGATGLLSTAHDYARFLQMLLNGGELDGTRILSPASVRLMTTNHVGELYATANYPGVGFGLGFAVKLDPAGGGGVIPPLASPGAFAWGGTFNTHFWVDPEQQLVVVVMAQLFPYGLDLHQKLGSIVYHAILTRPPPM